MNNYFYFFILFTFSNVNIAVSQIDNSFISYLSGNQLQREHLTYLQSLKESDSLNFYFAKYYLQYPNDSLFLAYYQKNKRYFQVDTNALNLANIYFLNSPNRNVWLELNMNQFLNVTIISKQVKEIQNSIDHPIESDVQLIPEKLQVDFQKYQKAFIKKPIIALSLSAVVPGLGKLYIGSTNSFGLTLFSLTLLGIQSYESYRIKGISHPLTIINLGFFTTYYAVNLVGSYRETKRKKEETKTQYLINATNYYRYKYRTSLY